MKLKRGIVVTGRVTDKATGKPVSGGVDMYTFADNPHIVEFPGYREGYRTDAEIRTDGTFQAVALPGRSLVAVRSQDAIYRGGVGSESIKGVIGERGGFDFYETLPERCSIRGYHRLAELNLDPDARTATVDLQVDPGNTLEITVLDPEGNPLSGTKVQGLGAIYPRPAEEPSPKVVIRGLDPSTPRRVTVWHQGRKLVGTAYLKGDESGSITLPLQPWGAVMGRVVDDEGKPRKGLLVGTLGGMALKHPETQAVLPSLVEYGRMVTDGEGRFRIEGLIPGLQYGGSAADGSRFVGMLFRNLVVKSGESRDLGEIKATEFMQED